PPRSRLHVLRAAHGLPRPHPPQCRPRNRDELVRLRPPPQRPVRPQTARPHHHWHATPRRRLLQLLPAHPPPAVLPREVQLPARRLPRHRGHRRPHHRAAVLQQDRRHADRTRLPHPAG